jgi:hypothetical protein
VVGDAILPDHDLLVNNFFARYDDDMKENEIERHFVWTVETMGGKTYKFTSPGVRGVADRVACLPDGSVWFVELKTKGGRLSKLQEHFGATMRQLNQNYTVIWNLEGVAQWSLDLTKK